MVPRGSVDQLQSGRYGITHIEYEVIRTPSVCFMVLTDVVALPVLIGQCDMPPGFRSGLAMTISSDGTTTTWTDAPR